MQDARADVLRDHLRSALRMARALVDEVLEPARRTGTAEDRQLASKAGGELAMLLRLAHRALTDAGDRREIVGLATDLAPIVRTAHVYRTALMRPSRAPMYALAHLCLSDLGLADARFDRLARAAFRSSVSAANERVPYRILDAAWTRHLALGDAELAHPALALSPLGAGVDLLEATTEDAYAFTHALPYATDFGRVPLPESVDRRYLLGVAEAIALKALDEDDLDLLAEVLMAPAILRLPWTSTLAFGWQVLERVWIEFGFVPGPGLREAPPDESRTDAIRRVLGTLYHTTFAAGLCAATLVSCDALPPPVDAGGADGGELPPGLGAMWKIDWHAASSAEREGLRFLDLGFVLRRAIENADLPRVRESLVSAADAGLIEHPLFVQALELFERIG